MPGWAWGRRLLLGIALGAGILACGGSPPPAGRVLLIGIDAATWDVMRPLMAAGRLPEMTRLADAGWRATLLSMEPTISPAIWTTIVTGKRPEKHGITGFLAPGDDGEPVPVTSNVRRTETLWTIASHAGRGVNVVGWYVTWPVEAIRGVMISDRFVGAERGELVGSPSSLTDDAPGVYPASLEPELTPLFVRIDRFLHPQEREFHRMFRAYPVDATRTAMAEYVMRERPADLTLVYLWGIDPIQHHFWKYHDPDTFPGPRPSPEEIAINRDRIPEYYADVDGFVGRLVAEAGPDDTIMLVSDHGAGPVETWRPGHVSGGHRLEGIIIAAGPRIRRGEGSVPPSVLDVAPTVLYLLGLPVAEDMDGTVIRDAIAPAFLAAHPPTSVKTYEVNAPRTSEAAIPSAADERIKARLRSLGYID